MYASVFCVYCFFSVSDAHLSIFLPCSWRCRMEEERGGRLSYSGKRRLKQLSKHCQQCSWALEKDLLVLLCVLSEVTHWSLWFLSRTLWLWLCTSSAARASNSLSLYEKINVFVHFHALSYCCGLVCATLVHICDHLLPITQAYDCTSNTSCRLLWNS